MPIPSDPLIPAPPFPAVVPPAGGPPTSAPPSDDRSDDDPDDDDDSDDDGALDDADREAAALVANAAHEHQDRLWLRAILTFLAGRSFDSDPSSRVQLASDLAAVAAYERISRIMHNDHVVDVDVERNGGDGRA